MLHITGYICLLLGLLCSLAGAGICLLHIFEQTSARSRLPGKLHLLDTIFLFLASALLLHALFWEDYSLEYVASYTDKVLPVFYRLTAFWAGQPGSMLFWALGTAIFGCIYFVAKDARGQEESTSLWFWAFFHTIMAFFCLVLTCWSNPFMVLDPVPVDGHGLNPLLQNPGMIFHPPLLFLGYAGFTVPCCLGLAQLLAGVPPTWGPTTRPFFIVSWVLLTAGIVLGAWWAYMELGWGGYWAWDPVENASLLPWLVGSAAIHILAIQAYMGKLNRAAVLLMALTVVSAFFATYLTRSGVIQSVHAFGDGGVGTPLTIFVVASFLLCLWICIASPSNGEDMGDFFSREGSLVLVAWIFVALAAIILLATMWPVLSKIWGSAAQGLDASFYNRVCLPLGTGLIALLCICFCLDWRHGLARPGLFYAICGAFLASGTAIWLAGYHKPLALLATACSTAAICAMTVQGIQGRKSLRKIAIAGLHLGVAILALGIAFSGPYTTERDLMLAKGQQETVGPYLVTLENIQDGEGRGYDYLRAVLKISRDGTQVGILKPERRIYAKFGDMQFSEVDVINGLGKDIYASLLGMDEDHKILVKVSLEPLVNWIWIGGTIMCLLPLVGLGRRKGQWRKS